MEKDLILVGRFGAPRGIAGEVRLQSFTRTPEAIGSYEPLLDASGAREFSILALRPLKGTIFAALVEGVTNRASASRLANVDLHVPRAALPEADEEEFYHADLIGLAARTQDGKVLGRVTDVLNFGAGDILEVSPAAVGGCVLMPFNKIVVPHIDVAAGFLIIVPPGEVEVRPEAQAS
ncbi:MAG TPA: ribosome maturation factor RimM [Methylocella sp.]|nr:ribosome maturation factor RimM [Methylocella sp.]